VVTIRMVESWRGAWRNGNKHASDKSHQAFLSLNVTACCPCRQLYGVGAVRLSWVYSAS
jgi:hypothetical protein